MHCLYFVGRCVVEGANIKDAPDSTVNCLLLILGGTFRTKRGQSALGLSVAWGHSTLGQTVRGTSCTRAECPGGHLEGGDNLHYYTGTIFQAADHILQ